MAVPQRKTLRLHARADAGALASRLERGDLVLFKPPKPDKHPIVRYQRLFVPPYSNDAIAFTHVAIFLGGDTIIHALSAVPWKAGSGGVQKDDIWNYGKGQTVCALRPTSITDTQRDAVIQEAVALEGTPYDFQSVMIAARDFMMRKIRINSRNPTAQGKDYLSNSLQYKRLICSRLVQVSYAKALGPASPLSVAGGRPSPVFTPADIYINNGFADVL